MTYASIAEIRAANAATGSHFFDRDTLRYWKSTILPGVMLGRYFVTSEPDFDGTDRRFTLREAQPDGSIKNVSEFRQYATARDARAAVTHTLA